MMGARARVALLAGAALLSACGSDEQVRAIEEAGELVVLTRNAPTTYYEDRDGEPAGIEHDMARDFAESLDVEVRFKVLDSIEDILAALREGRGHVAAAGLTRTHARADEFRFGPAYQQVTQQVVCRRGGSVPDSPAELAGVELEVIASSSYVERLEALADDNPDLEWTTTRKLATEQLLERVWRKGLDCTVADSNIVALNRRYFPELVVAFDLSEPQSLAWALPKEAAGLEDAVEDWLDEYRASGELTKRIERYYGFVRVFDYVDVAKFKRRVRHRLPKYRVMFERAARRYGFDWTLVAAQSYQESHWDPHARSPTGVRGIMMLTQPTARAMGVKSRLDARENIFAGAKYLDRLRRWLPDEVTGADRTWLALATYNVGMGHMRDAFGLAERLRRNPHAWGDMKTVLPLLAQKRYYRRLKHGYARGNEPVRYVQRIRNYQHILEQQVAATGVDATHALVD